MKSFLCSLLTALAMSGCSVSTQAKAPENKQPPTEEQVMKLTRPSEQHKVFEQLVGTWDYTVTLWEAPNKPPQTMTGTSENSLILGGRFLMQNVKGSDANMPFEGIGVIGYDNVRGEYVSTWMDNMTTGISLSSGAVNTTTGAIDQDGVMSCPMTQDKDLPFHTSWKIVDADHNEYTSHVRDMNGRDFKNMEIHYVRKMEVLPMDNAPACGMKDAHKSCHSCDKCSGKMHGKKK